MRDILFRGKRKDNGEWIVGTPIIYEDGRTRIIESHTDIFCYVKDSSIIQTVAHEVDPETVGQWTGMYDNTKWDDLTEEEREDFTRAGNFPSEWKGKKIFEGDIIKITWVAREREPVSHVASVMQTVNTMKIEEAIRKLNILKEKFGIILKDMPDLCDTCIEALKEKQWISLEKRLPNYEERVLVMSPWGIDIWLAVTDEDGTFLWDSGEACFTKDYALYWMPLPKPPNGAKMEG